MKFIRRCSPSISMVVIVMLIILVLQEWISYSTVFGKLDQYIPGVQNSLVPTAWLLLRFTLMALIILLWVLNKKY